MPMLIRIRMVASLACCNRHSVVTGTVPQDHWELLPFLRLEVRGHKLSLARITMELTTMLVGQPHNGNTVTDGEGEHQELSVMQKQSKSQGPAWSSS